MKWRNFSVFVVAVLSLTAPIEAQNTPSVPFVQPEALPPPLGGQLPIHPEASRKYFQDTAIGELDVRPRLKLLSGEQRLLPRSEAQSVLHQTPPVSYDSSLPEWHARQGKVYSPTCHEPLYFEDVNLERFGNERRLFQSVVSPARFFLTIPTLPYQIIARSPQRCRDHYYPRESGRRMAHVNPRQRFSPRAAVYQAFVVVSLVALIP